jgi:hypothetical protein
MRILRQKIWPHYCFKIQERVAEPALNGGRFHHTPDCTIRTLKNQVEWATISGSEPSQSIRRATAQSG